LGQRTSSRWETDIYRLPYGEIGMTEENEAKLEFTLSGEDFDRIWETIKEKGGESPENLFCTVEILPNERQIKLSCEPIEEEAEDKLVGKVIRRIIKVKGNIIGPWKERIGEWLKACIMGGGLPMFRTRYAGARWGENMVMAVCYGEEEPPISGGFFIDVPEEDIERMEKETGDWRWLVEKYGDDELKAYVAERYRPPKVGIVRLLRELAERK